MAERSLQHRDPDSKDDETLRREARVHLASEPALQLVAELIARLRELDLPWWTPVKLRDQFGAVERMGWFRERSLRTVGCRVSRVLHPSLPPL